MYHWIPACCLPSVFSLAPVLRSRRGRQRAVTLRRMQTLAELGEAALIARIEARARKAAKPWVVIGIGDDAAVVKPRAGEDLVVSADTLVEDVHFRFSTQYPATVGRRALAVNLSDLAAMGARPLGCTLALSAPADLAVARALSLVDGLVAPR